MANYYFLGTILPELRIGEKPEMSLVECEQLIYDNLSTTDFALINRIRNFYDIPNLLSYWKGESFSQLGNFDYYELEEALATKSGLPEYIFKFLEKYETKDERLKHYPELLATFFQVEIASSSGSFREYLVFERDLRLILVAFRAKQMSRDLFIELQYEDPEDEIVAQILAQKDAAQYEPPEQYADIKILLIKDQDHPLALQKALLEYRFNKIEEILGQDLFSTCRMMGYMIQLIMVERWMRLDKEKGLEIVSTILQAG